MLLFISFIYMIIIFLLVISVAKLIDRSSIHYIWKWGILGVYVLALLVGTGLYYIVVEPESKSVPDYAYEKRDGVGRSWQNELSTRVSNGELDDEKLIVSQEWSLPLREDSLQLDFTLGTRDTPIIYIKRKEEYSGKDTFDISLVTYKYEFSPEVNLRFIKEDQLSIGTIKTQIANFPHDTTAAQFTGKGAQMAHGKFYANITNKLLLFKIPPELELNYPDNLRVVESDEER